MPSRVYIKLSFEKAIEVKELTPDKVHGLFFSLIGGKLADKLHREYGNVKPYSLYCGEVFSEEPKEELILEVNLLEDSLLPSLLSELLLGKKQAVIYMKEPIKGNFSIKVPQKWVKSYETLIEEVESRPKVGIRFVSPTTFRRNDVDFPFPLPELIFKGLVKKWLSFSKIPIDVDLREYYNRIEVEKYELRTEKVNFSNGGKLTTFKGYAVYNLSKVNVEALKWLNILLSYARWSLVGRKTTMGLGKVRIFGI